MPDIPTDEDQVPQYRITDSWSDSVICDLFEKRSLPFDEDERTA